MVCRWSELDPDLRAWADKSGPRLLLTELRTRLVNGGKLRGRMRFRHGPITEDQRREIVELVGDHNAAVSTHWVQLDRAAANLRQSRYAMSLEELVQAWHGPVITKVEAKRRRVAAKVAQVAEQHRALLEIMDGVPQLEHERDMLAALGPAQTLRVPPGTATKAGAWTSYAAAVKAAAFWWPTYAAVGRVPVKSVAATALRDSGKWTRAGRLAFQNLVGMPFDQAVVVEQTEIRVKGPLVWRTDDVIVDARAGSPWVSVPARGALELGVLEARPDGVLLVENQTNFQHVCTDSAVPQRWLCVWFEGFASNDLVRFVRTFAHCPLAAWCDLDPSGIEIIDNLGRKAGRPVHAVGMEPDLWRSATKRDDSAADRVRWKRKAEHLAEHGPQQLRPLAHAISATGERVEQEEFEVYQRVLPTLVDRLDDLRRPG